MKKFFITTILFFGIHLSYAQDVIKIETEGNLESPKPCGCIELSEVTNENNPADILTGLGKCIELKQFEKAAKLFAISGVYGKFDISRVKDKTAHQALIVLQQNIFMNIEEEDQTKLIKEIKKHLKEKSKELEEICNTIQKIGMPKYFPKYMIQHGIQAFTEEEKEGNGLVEDFNSEESWKNALKTYLHCGE